MASRMLNLSSLQQLQSVKFGTFRLPSPRDPARNWNDSEIVQSVLSKDVCQRIGVSCRGWSNVGRLRKATTSVSRREGLQRNFAPSYSMVEPGTVPVEADCTELPCLPFPPSEVFVPSSTKVLHLYEARFLVLLEEVMAKYDNLFAHVVIEPVSQKDDKGVASFLATYGCLVRVERVMRLEVGAAVTIRGIGRIKLVSLTQLDPFLKSMVVSLKDESPKDAKELALSITDLQQTLSSIQELQLKLKVSKDEILQTPLENAIQWAEKGDAQGSSQPFVPSREERLSFAALQPIAGSSPGEQHKLLQQRLFAMEAMDATQRLKRVIPFAKETLASLAAKVALQSLNL